MEQVLIDSLQSGVLLLMLVAGVVHWRGARRRAETTLQSFAAAERRAAAVREQGDQLYLKNAKRIDEHIRSRLH